MQRCGRCRVAVTVRTASYAQPLCLSGVRLGPTEVALRPRSPSSQSGASRIEWKFDFSSRECLVLCTALSSARSWAPPEARGRCNAFSGRQQTRARERVLNRTLHATLQDTLEGGYTFFIRVRGPRVHSWRRNRSGLAPGWFHCDFAEISRRMYEEIRSSRDPRDHVEDG